MGVAAGLPVTRTVAFLPLTRTGRARCSTRSVLAMAVRACSGAPVRTTADPSGASTASSAVHMDR